PRGSVGGGRAPVLGGGLDENSSCLARRRSHGELRVDHSPGIRHEERADDEHKEPKGQHLEATGLFSLVESPSLQRHRSTPTRAASNAAAVTTDVAYRLSRSWVAKRSSTRSAVVPASAETTPAPRSSSASDLVDLVRGLVGGIRKDLLEGDPHQRSEERHDQH